MCTACFADNGDQHIGKRLVFKLPEGGEAHGTVIGYLPETEDEEALWTALDDPGFWSKEGEWQPADVELRDLSITEVTCSHTWVPPATHTLS